MIAFEVDNGGLKWGDDNGLSHGYCGNREINDKNEAVIYSAGHIPFVYLSPKGIWLDHTVDVGDGNGAVAQTSYQMFQDTLTGAGFGI